MQETIGINEYIKDSLIKYGTEVNSNRAFPISYDGLIPVYRRIIYAGLDFTDMRKTATIAGKVMGSTHPHGDQSIVDATAVLVRQGIFSKRGQFGRKSIIKPRKDEKEKENKGAKPRYTECKLADKYRELISPLMPYVPKKEAEISGFIEPEYIPTPIPLAFNFPRIGLGIGANTRCPMFTNESVVEALLFDDPNKLRAPYGMKINYSESELDSLWRVGIGRIQYEYNVDIENPSGDPLIVIHAKNASIFQIDTTPFDKYIDQGKMFSINLSDGERVAYALGRNARVDYSNFDECLELAKKVATNKKCYRLTVSDGKGHSFCIPMREWLKECYNNYISLVEKMKSDKLQKATFNKQVYELLPAVGKLIVNNPSITDAEILNQVKGLTESVLKVILSKSISQLRKGDTSKEVTKYDEEIKKWTKLDPVEYTKEVMHKL